MRLRQHVSFLQTLGFSLAILIPAVACGDKPATTADAGEAPKVYVDTSDAWRREPQRVAQLLPLEL